MRVFKKSEEILILGVIVLIWFSFVYFFIIENNIQTCSSIKQITKAKYLKLLKYKRNIQNVEKLKSEGDKISSLAKPNQSEEVDKAKLLTIIDNVQKKTGISIEKISPLKSEKKSVYKRYLVQIEIKDSILEVIKFIMELRSTPQKLSLVNLRITPAIGLGEKLKVSIRVAQLMVLK